MKKLLGIYAALGMFSDPMLNAGGSTRIEDINFTPKQPPLPNGCKEYFFNTLGDFLNYNDGLYCYKCIASSDKVAINKFNKWKQKQLNNE